MEWLPIDTAPAGSREMFVVRGFDVSVGSGMYTTDPWCVFVLDGKFVRWPHQFPPTHWCKLPEFERVHP